MEVVLVTCAVIFSDSKVLCAQRSDTMPLPGFWEFPGGKVEKGESPEACLIRELREELAIDVGIIGPLKPTEHSYAAGKKIRLLPFVCSWESGDISLLEHQAVKWLIKEELNSLGWAAADWPIVVDLIENWNNIQKELVDYTRGN
ncbi:(deoxy)nucleoside triphosphate pyrophosphohydrolase [Algoriphagus resistens]|uniref:(deoxy)nucleoside triphosphate pyrophosphohydrolase n=1 Tax=Algoriphagus resistens TaxID=1750590 RepID=UPI000716A561|nr:(deoxy)nucleoside triphosphate pyrophosphohydrolase [Algoriphagus resistens]